ncbi:pilus assembly protein TadG-related protein [Streptomyces sp. NPDC020742]|uniref:pilus assembly protein TadG-related protein n=1 Tax=unclassified Streptomyces TaxID=2593676 RepID=UPI0033FFACE2
MTADTTRRSGRDAGQAFPLYIVAVAGLLFLALAFFAVGQAAATRNGAQTAADAAALAAGQKYRDLLTKDLLDGLRDGGYESDRAAWEDLLNGRGAPSPGACASAAWFAGRNDAEVSSCVPDSWPTSFAVDVTTRHGIGRSVVPGKEDTRASARATSVVGPRCTLGPAGKDGGGTGGAGGTDSKDKGGKGGKGGNGETGGRGGTGGTGGTPGKGGKDGEGDAAAVTLTCDGKDWTLDPEHLRELPDAADLFSVRLAH